MKKFSSEEIKPGDNLRCVAIRSDSPQQRKMGIYCIGKCEDGRIVLFDKESSLSKIIRPGDLVEGTAIVAKPNFIIIKPEKIGEGKEKLIERIALPSTSSRWDHSLIISIRREKEKQKSPDLTRALTLLSKGPYGERTHYVLELIQNAEDEFASGISFTTWEDRIEVWNNGEVFTPDDVKSICSVWSGKKNKIGFFGIGFKSVFNITDRAQVVSGRYNFVIEDFIYPTPCDTDPPEGFDPKRGAWFILLYNRNKHKPADLEQSMKDLDEKVLLFLDNLKEITFMNVVTGNSWYLERRELEGNVISLFNSSNGVLTRWRVFRKDLKVPKELQVEDELRPKPEATRIVIAFPVPSNGEVQDVTSEPVYCYLPTKKRTDMPFLIQGDFDPTVGRENITDSDWNKWLLSEIGELAVEAYQILKDEGITPELLFRYIPASDEVKDSTFMDVYKAIRGKLTNCAIAPTDDGGWVAPPQVVVDASNGHLKSLIGNDIEKLKGEGVGYLSSAVGERGQATLLELGARPLTLNDLIDYVQREELLEARVASGPHWFLRLYAYLGQEFYKQKIPSDRARYDAQLAKLKAAKMILTTKNELVAVDDPEKPGIVIFYPLKVNLDEEYSAFSGGEVEFIHHYFQKDTILRRKVVDHTLESLRDEAKEFLNFLGVRRYYDDYTIVNDVICRRLEHADDLSDKKILEYTNFVRENLKQYVSRARKYKTTKSEEEILEDLGGRLTVKAYYLGSGSKINTFCKVSEVYLSEAYGDGLMEKLFEGVPNVFFLSDLYAKAGDAKQWADFFKRVGVWASPKVIRVKSKQINRVDPVYKWIPFQGYGEHVLEDDWISPDLETLFAYTASQDKETRAQRSKFLWTTLNENWNKRYRKADSCLYRWRPISRWGQTRVKGTSFLNLLLKSSWVLASDGSLCKPTDLFTHTKRNYMLLGNSVKYLAMDGHRGFIKALKINEDPTKQGVMEHLKQLETQGVSYTKDTLEKFTVMHAFLMELPEKPSQSETRELESIKEEVEGEGLIYIPRKDKEWWSPSKVFWGDQEKIFGRVRGYLSPFYSPDAFPTFNKLGVKESADLEDCIAVLTEISKCEETTDITKAIIHSVYLECDRLLATKECPQTTIEKLKGLNLLTRKHGFAPASDLVFADEEGLAELLSQDAKILWLGCAYLEISHLLEALQVKPLSLIVDVEIKPVDVTDAPQSITEMMREWSSYLEPWVRYKRSKLCSQFVSGFENLRKVQILEAEEIHVSYKLKGEPIITRSSSCEVYYDAQENKLYLLDSLDPYSPKITSQICRMFVGGDELKEPILALLSAGEDDKRRLEVFEQFGIPMKELPRLIIDKVEPKQVEEIKEGVMLEVKKLEQLKQEDVRKPEPAKLAPLEEVIKFGPILINPDDFMAYEIKELSVSSQSQNSQDIRPVVRVAKKPVLGSRRRTRTITISPQYPEDVAFKLVKKFEESEKRIIDETPRNQKNVGYDLSSLDTTSKRFIEIKSSKYDNIAITMTRSEWRKAELERDNYYLYVVTGLRAGGMPKLRIIQNPCAYLKPDAPKRINITNWHNVVRYEVSYIKKD